MRKRGCIVSKLLAKVETVANYLHKYIYLLYIGLVVLPNRIISMLQMMCKSGLSHIITMDLHQKEIQGFFDCPVDNLRASPFLLQYIQESVSVFIYKIYWNLNFL